MKVQSNIFSGMKDCHLATLHRLGRDSGARPFFRHPKMMIALRDEMERRGILSVPKAEQHWRDLMVKRVYKEMKV